MRVLASRSSRSRHGHDLPWSPYVDCVLPQPRGNGCNNVLHMYDICGKPDIMRALLQVKIFGRNDCLSTTQVAAMKASGHE